MLLSSCQPKSIEDSQRDYVYEVCLEEIYQRLKAPSTAIFSSFANTDITQKIRTYPNDGVLRAKWIVYGFVDAQNSFSAQLRTSFSCEFTQWKNEIKIKKVDF